MMEKQFADELKMHPTVLSSRYFNSRNFFTEKTAERQVEFFEIAVYLENEGRLFINGEGYHIERGFVRFSVPGDILCSQPHYSCLSLVFTFNGEDYSRDFISAIPAYFKSREDTIETMRKIVAAFASQDCGSKVLVNALFFNMLYSFYLLAAGKDKLHPAVKTCMDYMEKHFSEQITLEKLGMITGYAPLHVLRLFKSNIGKTPHDILVEIRMNNACTFLDSTTKPMAEIAEICGFNSVSHFQELFKKKLGTSPGRYRKSIL